MGLLFSALISSFFTASIAFCQVVEEGTNGHWVDTPEGPDVMEKTVDHQLWVPNPVSQRVSDKDVVLMAPLLRTQKSSASFLHKRAKRKRKTTLKPKINVLMFSENTGFQNKHQDVYKNI